jgi:hypothetical protein
MKHIMLDIETLALTVNSAVWQVGIQPFTLWQREDGTWDTEYVLSGPDEGWLVHMRPTQQRDFVKEQQFDVNTGTVEWTKTFGDKENFEPWFAGYDGGYYGNQPENMRSIQYLHALLVDMIGDPKETVIWSKGKEFDIAILKHQFEVAGLSMPWYYRNLGCLRSYEIMLGISGIEKPQLNFVHGDNAHNALADARVQVAYLVDMLTELRFGFPLSASEIAEGHAAAFVSQRGDYDIREMRRVRALELALQHRQSNAESPERTIGTASTYERWLAGEWKNEPCQSPTLNAVPQQASKRFTAD